MSDNTKMFTEDEKIIARKINKKFKWMARDKSGSLFVYVSNPTKEEKFGAWVSNNHYYISINVVFDQGLFKSIKWKDAEPTKISDIYNPQILDDIEQKYLKTILEPFHDEVDYVKKLKDYRKEYLYIKLYDGEFTFPDFDAGKMYSGMKVDKKYKLDELGIKY